MNISQAVVHLVDDDFAIRDSLEMLIQSNGYSVSSYPSAYSFLEKFNLSQPGCLVLDVRMPNMNGLELQEELLEKGINIPIIFISGNADIQDSSKAFRAGALDFLEKPFNHHVLIERIDEAIKQDVDSRFQITEKSQVKAHLESLTSREKEVLKLIVNGHTNKEVAKKLNISYRTVDAHRARVMQKMHTDSIATLVSLIAKHGLF